MGKKWVVGTIELLVVLGVVAVIVGQVVGQPVLIGFVISGSMQPALAPGDGFVAIPSAIAGDIQEGDVVTFRAKEIQGGGLTTHRVVEVTERGYITRGDNNPFTDQDSGEPPVKRPQIVAVAWQPGGSVLSIPGIGAVVTGVQNVLTAIEQQVSSLLGVRTLLGTQGLAYVILLLSIVVYVADVALYGEKRDRQRETIRNSGLNVKLLIGIFACAVILSATVAMVGSSGPQEFAFISSESDRQGIDVIESGTSESATYVLGNSGAIPMVVYFDSKTNNMGIEPLEVVIPSYSTVNASLTLTAPPETGYYRQYVVEHRYLLVLPQSVIRGLYEIHPWLPIVAIDAVLGVPFYITGVMLLGSGRYRSRSQDRPTRIGRLRSRLSYYTRESRMGDNDD